VTEGADGGTAEFFTLDKRDRALSERGDPLVRLASLINFEVFRAPLAAALRYSYGSRGPSPLRSGADVQDPAAPGSLINCDAVFQITSKDGVKAIVLWELFLEGAGSAMSITQFGMEMTRLVAGPRCRHGDHDDFGISATNRLLLWSDCNLIEGQKAYRRCLVLGGIVGPFVGTVRAHSAGSSCARATGSLKGGAETARPRAD